MEVPPKTCVGCSSTGSMLKGQIDHSLLKGAELVGSARTGPEFELFEVGAYGALVPEGRTSVTGEVYLVSRSLLAALDVARQVPILFERVIVRLEGEEPAHAYAMRAEQVRGKRRLAQGDFRLRFASNVPRADPGPFVRWARQRR